MLNIRNIIFLGVMAFCVNTNAQDLHFTQYYLTPLNVNPGLIGNFSGSYRIGANVRDQWRGVSGNKDFASITLHADSPIIRGFREKDWIGVGINIFRDQSGDLGLIYQGQIMGLAYHFGFGKKTARTTVLSVGAQFGNIGRKLDPINAKSRYELEFGDGNDPDLNTLQGSANEESFKNENSFSDWTVGAVLSTKAGKTSSFQFGLSAAHITRPNQTIFNPEANQNPNPNPEPDPEPDPANVGLTRDRLPIRMTGFAKYDTQLNSKMKLTPQVLVQAMGSSLEIVPQVHATFLLNEEKKTTFLAGVGARVVNAADFSFLLGMGFKDIQVGLSYDLNFAQFTPATNTYGGLELGVTYIGKIYKKPKVEPVLICPRL